MFTDLKQVLDSVWRPSSEYYGMEADVVQFIVEVSRETRTVVRRGKIVTEDFNTALIQGKGCCRNAYYPHIYLTYT